MSKERMKLHWPRWRKPGQVQAHRDRVSPQLLSGGQIPQRPLWCLPARSLAMDTRNICVGLPWPQEGRARAEPPEKPGGRGSPIGLRTCRESSAGC